MKWVLCVALWAGLLAGQAAQAQDEVVPVPPRPPLLKLALPPLLVNGLHLELERPLRPGEQVHFLALSTQLYYGSSQLLASLTDREFKDEDLWGAGVTGMFKSYWRKAAYQPMTGFYTGYGAGLQYFHAAWNQRGFTSETNEDGLTYLVPIDRRAGEQIVRLSGMAVLGLQEEIITDRLRLDLYVGLGLRKSFIATHYNREPRFDQNSLDLGYSGLYVPAGVKLGLLLGPR